MIDTRSALNSFSATNSTHFFTVTVQLAIVANQIYGELVDWDEFTKNELANNGKVLYDNMNKMLGVEKATKSVVDVIEVTTGEIKDTTDEIKVTTDVIKGTTDEIKVTTDEIKELVTPPKYNTAAKNAGCDGIDQDFVVDSPTNMADNCEEDNYPPELVLLERLPVVNVDDPDADVFRLEKSFSNKDEAISYLESTTQVIDDCSRPELLTRNVELVGGLSCSDSEFKVTPIQEQCADSGNFLAGKHVTFLLDVDEDAPVVSCGFRETVPGGKAQLTRWVDGNNLFLRLEGGSNWNPVDAGLFYEVTVRSCNVSWIRSRKAVVGHSANINYSCLVTWTRLG
jgi:hypothetical protein